MCHDCQPTQPTGKQRQFSQSLRLRTLRAKLEEPRSAIHPARNAMTGYAHRYPRRGTEQLRDASRTSGIEHRQPHSAPRQVQSGGRESPAASERQTNQQHSEVAQRQRHRREGQRQDQSRANGDDGAGADHDASLLDQARRVVGNTSIGMYCSFQHFFLTNCKDGLRRFLFFGGAFRGVFDHGPNLGVHLFLAQVPLDAEMDRQTHSYNCNGAQH